ncbi:stromal 70 kDa heat shock-related protein, chloroplastic-like [Bidens hawaiensis]|uniref:stromal 70 kDa heat shock-related protein, chloroplastic-like n=1 Tax=Bidens hawaiensis TaxID=980011 RepID=UPI00404B3DBE
MNLVVGKHNKVDVWDPLPRFTSPGHQAHWAHLTQPTGIWAHKLGKKQDITITGASTLPSDEVERMVNEAEKFAKEDKEKRDAIDTKNQADSVVYQTEKQLKELGDKVPAPVKEKVEAKLGELKEAISDGSTQAIKDAMAALNQEVMQLGQSLYNKPGVPGAEPSQSSDMGDKGPEGDVIDAYFTDSK